MILEADLSWRRSCDPGGGFVILEAGLWSWRRVCDPGGGVVIPRLEVQRWRVGDTIRRSIVFPCLYMFCGRGVSAT